MKHKRLISIITLLCFAFTFIPAAAFAEDSIGLSSDIKSLTQSSSGLLDLEKQPPAELANVINPYGYKEDVAFAMSVSNELLYLGGEDGDKHTHVFNGNDFESLKSFVNAPNKGSGSYALPGGTWNWVQAVAFDSSTDSARDNQVLFVGVKDEGDQCAYAWVLNYDNGKNTIIGPTKIGKMSWIGNSYEMYTSTTLIEVAAGDFNGDGVDTLLVYVPLNLDNDTSDGCSLFELKYDGNSLTLGGKGNHLLMDTFVNDQASKKYKDQHAAGEDDRDKLAVSMQVADFNGDTIDDLAVLSYSHNRTRGGSKEYYSPELNICYGSSSVSDISKIKASATYKATGSDNGKHVFPLGACLAAGDYNGDGYDDLYVTGVKATYDGGIGIDENNWYLQSWNGKLSNGMTGGNYATTASNEWFRGGFYTDDTCYSKVMSAGVAISGHAAPEMLFICGALYDVTSGTPMKVAENGYFQSKDQGLNSVTCTNAYVQSVAVGNFDNNSADREQVVFVLGLKERGHDDYWFMSGCIGGSEFNDGTTADGSPSYGAAVKYYCTDMDDDASYIHTNKGDDIDEGLNCSLITLDYDKNDGMMAKYRGATFAYTDPQVRAVLQAAPYFGDISNGVLNSTGYTLTTNYVHEDIDGHSTDFSIGLQATGGFPVGVTDYKISAGYKHTWNRTVTESHETSYENMFYACGYDTVVVHRIPLIIYQYEVADSNGAFKDNDYINMQFSMPKEPVWEQMSIDKYNQFVQDYNAKMETGKDPDGNKIKYFPLVEISQENSNADWLEGNEGNPYAYNHTGWSNESIRAEQISKSAYSLGTSGGGVSESWSEGDSTNTEETHGCGFYVSGSIAFGVAKIGGGAEGNFDYTRNWGSAECNGSAVGYSCTVTDLDEEALLAGGMDEATLELYDFDWTFGSWSHDLGMRDEDGKVVYTPFLGYNVTNVSSPPRAPYDLKAEAAGSGGIRLTWKQPETPAGWPEVDGYSVYQITGSGVSKVKEMPGSASECIIDNLVEDTDYTFCIRSYHNNDNGTTSYSALSNEATAHTAIGNCRIVVEYDESNLTMTVDEQSVANDEELEVPRGTTISVHAEATTGSYLLFSMGFYPIDIFGAEMESVLSEDGKTVTTEYTVNRDIGILAYGAEKFDSMKVNFTESVTDMDALAGTVSASIGTFAISNGATVSDPVTFRAEAEAGYRFTGWDVTANGKTMHFTNDEITIPLIVNQVTVEATFESVETKHLVTVEQPSEGGQIVITDEDGNELQPVAGYENTYRVLHNTPVTVLAEPQIGYLLSAWTGAAANHDSEQVTITITEDTTIGAVFRAPVKYDVYYTTSDAYGNRVTTEPDIASGTSVAAGTPVTFTVQAADGYRISGWTVTRNGVETDYYAKAEHVTSGSATETIQSETSVEVTFVPMESYTISARQTGKGTVSILCGNSVLSSGDKVPYISDVTLLAKPAEGWKLTSISNWVELADGSYTLNLDDVEENHLIDVVFEQTSAPGENTGTGGSGDGYDYNTPAVIPSAEEDETSHEDCVCGHYTDLDEKAWYHGPCVYVINHKLMGGTGINEFSPHMNLSRAMMVQILYNLEGRPAVDMTSHFDDVRNGDWYAVAIAWATQNGVVNGVGSGKFAPDASITREQMAAMFRNYAAYKQKDVTANTDISGYADAGAVSRYAEESMKWAVAKGLLKGTSATTLEPLKTASRAEAAAILMRFVEGFMNEKTI